VQNLYVKELHRDAALPTFGNQEGQRGNEITMEIPNKYMGITHAFGM
jgi:hypothetical protein